MPGIDKLLADRLEARGFRMTPSRLAVLKAIASKSGHFTAEEICAQVGLVGRATVFRTMKLLVDLGLVCRVLLESGNLHYRLSHREHHHHLICDGCGSVKDFSSGSLESVVQEMVGSENFEIEGHWLEVYGKCTDCRAVAVPA